MRRRTQAFTLVELLLALTITSILVLVLVNVVSAALNIWEQGRNQIDTLANSRQVLGRIADEIKGAIAAPAPNQIEFSENVAAFGASQSQTSENIFFVAPYPNLAAGDLCVIAYRHDAATHELQRGFVDSQNAWDGAPKYVSTGYPNLVWRTIAQGVIEFEIQSYSQTELDNAASAALVDWNSTTGAAPMSGNTPRQVVIRIKVVDEKALARLAGLAPGNAVYDRIVAQAARQLTASVMLSVAH
jgi:prepilin-type N-terminal cleavage/methylation domain-containing protein